MKTIGRMRRAFISWLLVCAMMVGLMPVVGVYAEDENPLTITVDTSAVGHLKQNDTFSVPVSITNNPGIIGFQQRITFDKSVFELTGYKKDDSLTERNGMITGFSKSTGMVLCEIKDLDGFVTGDGGLYIAEFKVKEDASDGRYNISITDSAIFKTTSTKIENVVYQPGLIIVGDGSISYSVTTNLANNMKITGGLATQTGLTGAMTDVVVTPNSGYKLLEPRITGSGVEGVFNTDGSYTISGTPTSNVTVTFADAVPYYSVTTNLGKNMSITSGSAWQTELTGAMTEVVVTPENGYVLSEPRITGTGITAVMDDDGSCTISGTPSSNVTVTFTDAEKNISNEVKSLKFKSDSISLKVGKTAQPLVLVEPENITDKIYIWKSENEKIATVEDGVVTAVKEGSTYISVQVDDKMARCKVTVVPVSYENRLLELSVENVTAKLNVGDVVKVRVEANNNTGYSMANILVDWDESALKLTSVDYNKENAPKVIDNLSWKVGKGILVFGDFMGMRNYSDTGTFLTLSFEILEDANPGKYDIGLSEYSDGVINTNWEDVELKSNSGFIELTDDSISEVRPQAEILHVGIEENRTANVLFTSESDALIVGAVYNSNGKQLMSTSQIVSSGETTAALTFEKSISEEDTVKVFMVDPETQEPLCEELVWEYMSEDEYAVALALSELTVDYQKGDNADSVTKDLILSTVIEDVEDVFVAWSSSDENVVKNNGSVTRPGNGQDATVNMTVTASKGEASDSKEFKINVIHQKDRADYDVPTYTEEDVKNDTSNPEIIQDEDGDQVICIDGDFADDVIIENVDDAQDAIQSIREVVGLTDAYEELETSVINIDEYSDNYSFDQMWNGVRVDGCGLTICADKDGQANYLNAGLLDESLLKDIDTNPVIGRNTAENNAKEAMKCESVLDDMTELVIYTSDECMNSPILVYVIYSDDSSQVTYINAKSGAVVNSFALLSHLNGSGVDEKGRMQEFPITEKTRGIFNNKKSYVMQDLDRNIMVYLDSKISGLYESNNTVFDDATAVSAYLNVRKTYDFYKDTFRMNSYNGNDQPARLPLIIHAKGDTDNASWNGNSILFYDNKNITDAISYAFCYDACLHEYGHAVTSSKSKYLSKGYEKNFLGAISEAYSDIFACVGTKNWLLCEEKKPGGIRNLYVPSNTINPSAYFGCDYVDPQTADKKDGNDFGAHQNSTIISHAAYLMNNAGIDYETLAHIWMDSVSKGYYKNSDFFTVRRNVVKSALERNPNFFIIANQAFEDVNIPLSPGDLRTQLGIYLEIEDQNDASWRLDSSSVDIEITSLDDNVKYTKQHITSNAGYIYELFEDGRPYWITIDFWDRGKQYTQSFGFNGLSQYKLGDFGNVYETGFVFKKQIDATYNKWGDLTWFFDSNTGTLTIEGKGKMDDFTYDQDKGDYVGAWRSLKDQIKNIIIRDGVTSIGKYSFYECSNLTNVELPNSITRIEEGAFNFCSNLPNIEIPMGVTDIGTWAFGDCSSLKTIGLPSSVTDLGACAFENCNSLESAILSSGMKYLRPWVFDNCISLNSVTIPTSITMISGFNESNSIKDVFYLGSKDQWNQINIDAEDMKAISKAVIHYTN